MESSDSIASTTYGLKIENELRFVVGDSNTVSIELLSGFAEIFGSELSQNTVYTFPPFSCISIFSWQGCSVKLKGNVLESHITSDSLIMIPVHIHACLEEQRVIAESNLEKGPVCLVVGSVQSGKSTFCRFLLNYATRMRRKPLYIDLDVSKNRSSMPGTISILPVDEPSHIIEGFSKQALSVYTFGHLNPTKNKPFYLLLTREVAKMIQKRLCNKKPNIYNSGVIIDTSSLKGFKGYRTIISAAHVFKVDVVFVVGKESLFEKVEKELSSNVKVVFIPPQKGIVKYNIKQKQYIRANLIERYFYGTTQNPVTPYEFEVNFSDIQIYSATNISKTNASKFSVKNMEIYNVPIEPQLVNTILGLSYADTLDENILLTTVRGFVCVLGIDMSKEIVKVLSPQPSPLPGKIFIFSFLRFYRDKCTISQ